MVVIEEKHRGVADDSLSSTSDISMSTTAPDLDVNQYCKEKLKNRLFVGHYQERRYVDHIRTYRDVVIVSDSEYELKKDLDAVKGKLKNFYPDAVWIGITEPIGSSSSYALWVKLHDLPFGRYWFQIKQINFAANEVRLRLQVLRPLELSDTAISTRGKQSSKSAVQLGKSAEVTSSKDIDTDWTESVPTLEECANSIKTWKENFTQKATYLIVTLMTLQNVKETFRFLLALIVAIATGLVHTVQFTGDFSIKFMREASGLIRSSTPIVLGVIDFFTKMVGGLYILLAMMWRGQNNTSLQPQFAATPYNSRSQLQIEPKYSKSDIRWRPTSTKLNYSHSSPLSKRGLQ